MFPFPKFKAKCLSLLEEVEKTKKPPLVTKFGKPIAEVNPPSLNQESRSWLGSIDGLTGSCGTRGALEAVDGVPAMLHSDWGDILCSGEDGDHMVGFAQCLNCGHSLLSCRKY